MGYYLNGWAFVWNYGIGLFGAKEMDLQELDLEELAPMEEASFLSSLVSTLSPTQQKLRIEVGKIIAMDKINGAEATNIFLFLGVYKYIQPEKQQVHKKLSEWITDWIHSWGSRFHDMSNYPHSFLYRASMACMVLSQFYSWDEQESIFQELNGKEFPDCTH